MGGGEKTLFSQATTGRLGPDRRRLVATGLLLLLSGIGLAGLQAEGTSLPLSAGLVCIYPFGLRTFCAALGAAVGYLLRDAPLDCAENLALTILLFSASAVFQGTRLPGRPWFWPLLSAGVCAFLGLLSLFGVGGTVWPWLLRWVVAAAGTIAFRAAAERQEARLPLFAAVIAGFCPAPGGQLRLFLLALSGAFFWLHHAARRKAAQIATPAPQERLEAAAQMLDLLCRQLPAPTVDPMAEARSVYDGAAEQLCRCCARYPRCWGPQAEETFQDLTRAARPILRRGIAERDDFPARFQAQCCHLDGFIIAVNQELEGMLFRRRYQMELQESRLAVAEEFSCMAAFLRAAAQETTTATGQYMPRLGSCSIGKGGSCVTGDRGACFAGRHGEYYVLLCDGMGTGVEAAQYSSETVAFLETLLRAGLEAESALKMLNGVELLRERDRFTTVDLLRLDLTEGTALLLKWGSAPSYHKGREGWKKIGTASPPPGVGVGGCYAPERYELSLKGGEMLVLASDGATGAEAALATYCGDSVEDLAALLVAGPSEEDDVSAVVVSLRRLSA